MSTNPSQGSERPEPDRPPLCLRAPRAPPGQRSPRPQGCEGEGRAGLDHEPHVPEDGGHRSYEAGLSSRVVADQLGHARPSIAQDVYMGRRAVDSHAVAALEQLIPLTEDDEKCT